MLRPEIQLWNILKASSKEVPVYTGGEPHQSTRTPVTTPQSVCGTAGKGECDFQLTFHQDRKTPGLVVHCLYQSPRLLLGSSHCRAEQPGVRPLSSQAIPEIGTWARTRDLGRPRKGPRSRSLHTELCGGLESGNMCVWVPCSLPQVLSAKNCLLKRQSRTLANYEFQKEKTKSNAYGIRCPQSCLCEIQI